MENDRKKYNAMENMLQKINKNFISLSDQETKRNNKILKTIISLITSKMAEKDSLFKDMYSIVFYGGSYYDGLKVAEPDEFDLDLLLTLPSSLETNLKEASNVPGFVHLKFLNFAPSMEKLKLSGKYKGLEKLINANHYLDTTRVLQWMQKVVQLAMNTFDKHTDGRYILKTPHGNFYAKIYKSGPAYTLKATGRVSDKDVHMDVDLVPCFVFSGDRWPLGGFRTNPVTQKPNFFIVPKQLKGIPNSEHYWRLSFQEQERVLLDKKRPLKPTIKLLKKMKELFKHKTVASYYIKTVALWTIDEKDSNFWNNSLSYVFMTVLKNYQKSLETGKIPYYWNKHYNLLGKVNPQTLFNINNKIKLIIEDIERHVEDPFVVAKYLVSPQEVLNLRSQYSI